jgi:hypothetical protein
MLLCLSPQESENDFSVCIATKSENLCMTGWEDAVRASAARASHPGNLFAGVAVILVHAGLMPD